MAAVISEGSVGDGDGDGAAAANAGVEFGAAGLMSVFGTTLPMDVSPDRGA